MQSSDQEQRENPLPPRTLEFRQAMKDFRTMFPTLESDLIECVLRSNAGHVDSTIDQLLQLSRDSRVHTKPKRTQKLRQDRERNQFDLYDDSTDSEDSIPSELLDALTSSEDDDVPVRDPPPMYTPRAEDPLPNFFGHVSPVEAPTEEKKKDVKRSHGKSSKKMYRSWNPPMLGTLPEDFLRILPQQFTEFSKEGRKASMSHKKRSLNGQTSTETSSFGNMHTERSTPTHPGGGMGFINPDVTPDANAGPVPPPRPPRTIDSHHSRRISQKNDRDRRTINHMDNIEHGNLFIQPAAFPDSHHRRSGNPGSSSVHNHRPRHHRSARSNSSRFSSEHSSHARHNVASANGLPSRRSSDFAHHRMVMVSRSSDSSMPLAHHSSFNGFHSAPPHAVERLSSHHSHRSSPSSCGHRQALTVNPSSGARTASNNTASLNSNMSGRSSVSATRSRQRSHLEEEQYVEDCRLAILLQNEEFIHELKRNEEFLKALEKDRHKETTADEKELDTPPKSTRDGVVPLPDPDAKYTHGAQNANSLRRIGNNDTEKDDESAFKENVRHMGKSARKKFNEIAKKFAMKRKTSYKAMRTIDPVFANCEDNFDEIPGSRPPTLDS